MNALYRKTIRLFLFFGGMGWLIGQALPGSAQSTLVNLTQYVDPVIGTGGHGHVFMGANVPFGAVQLGPTQMSKGWDWSSGYHASDSLLIGFAHTHLSGTGAGDLGDILVMPTTGAVKLTRGTAQDSRSGYGSRFAHADEIARPGYYAVTLKRYAIRAELTTTERVGFHRYTFPASTDAHILIDLQEGINWDMSTDTYLEKVNDTTLVGYRFSSGMADRQRIYFAAVFSRPIRQMAIYDDQTLVAGTKAQGVNLKGVIDFTTSAGDQVSIKVGISPVSTTNALANVRAELPHWNFDNVAAAADRAWNRELNKIVVNTPDKVRLRTFYTALYHTMIAPSLFNDHNGDYRGTDQQVRTNAPFTNLTTFSLWDTYRAAHPLFTLTQPQRTSDMMNSMLAIYQQQGRLPIWHLMGCETYAMPGNNALPVLADACLKDVGGFDQQLAYEALKVSALHDDRGLHYVKQQGYIPADLEKESVAKGLEYAIDDWCVAQVARKLGRNDDYIYFLNRSKNYRRYFDPQVRFMRGRLANNTWRVPFDPIQSEHRNDDFSEGNAWQYTWLVPHDVEGLVGLLGGTEGFRQKLDSLFIVKGDLGGGASADITGLIGQYAHGNEPSHHIAYLYPYVGQPHKTADKVRYILDSLYTDRPDGLCGNEDVGQMSAWYVFSALGFYPVNPANGAYVFGSPVFDNATLQLADGNTFRIVVRNNSATRRYVQRMTLNGKPYTRTYIRHQDIINGGELIIDMSDQPSLTWGVQRHDWPRSAYTTSATPPSADLSVTLETEQLVCRVGEPVAVRLQLHNHTATTESVSALWEHRLPSQLELVQATGMSYTDGVLTGTVNQLAGQTDTTFRFLVRPLRSGVFKLGTELISASADDPDSQVSSGLGDGEDDAAVVSFRTTTADTSQYVSPNPYQLPLPVLQGNQPPADPEKADLSLHMQVSSRAPALNQLISYTLTVANGGGQEARGVEIVHELPPVLTLLNGTGNVLTHTIDSIAPGTSRSIVVSARVTGRGEGLSRAQITVSSKPDSDSVPANGYGNGEDDTACVDIRIR